MIINVLIPAHQYDPLMLNEAVQALFCRKEPSCTIQILFIDRCMKLGRCSLKQ